MNSDAQRLHIGKVPAEYDQRFTENMLRDLAQTINVMLSAGNVRCSKLNIGNIPTASTGLRSGDVWSNSGVLTIVT